MSNSSSFVYRYLVNEADFAIGCLYSYCQHKAEFSLHRYAKVLLIFSIFKTYKQKPKHLDVHFPKEHNVPTQCPFLAGARSNGETVITADLYSTWEDINCVCVITRDLD